MRKLALLLLSNCALAASASSLVQYGTYMPGPELQVTEWRVYTCPYDRSKTCSPPTIVVSIDPATQECSFGNFPLVLDTGTRQRIKWSIKAGAAGDKVVFRGKGVVPREGAEDLEDDEDDEDPAMTPAEKTERRFRVNRYSRTYLTYDLRITYIAANGTKVKCKDFGPTIVNRG